MVANLLKILQTLLLNYEVKGVNSGDISTELWPGAKNLFEIAGLPHDFLSKFLRAILINYATSMRQQMSQFL